MTITIGRKTLAVLAAIVAVLFLTASSCSGSDSSGQKKETQIQQDNYNHLVDVAPAHKMQVSSTRDTINFWIDTWGKNKNALSYNYIGTFAADGTFHSALYYVLVGLPVSYCTSLTPNYQIKVPDVTGDNTTALVVPAPALDGVYYSGGECNVFYGKDAQTGSYVEYTVPLNAMVQTFSQPQVGEAFNHAVRVNGGQ